MQQGLGSLGQAFAKVANFLRSGPSFVAQVVVESSFAKLVHLVAKPTGPIYLPLPVAASLIVRHLSDCR